MFEKVFTAPQNALSADPRLRREFLDNYFPFSLIPMETESATGWEVGVMTPLDASFYVDPSLEASLNNWNPSIEVSSLPHFFRLSKAFFLSFFDSWSLYFWSLLIDWLKATDQPRDKIAIIHLDDHRDLDSPLIYEVEGKFVSLISGEEFDLEKPESVRRAIMDRSISIGSYFSPLLHRHPHWDVFHVRHAHSHTAEAKGIQCQYLQDTFLKPDARRPSLELVDDLSPQYRISSCYQEFLPLLQDYAHIFLHIDCDTFANRFNGDSNWSHYPCSIDMSLSKMKAEASALLSDLATLGLPVYVNVALSPGFFPAENWAPFLRHLEHETLRFNLELPPGLSEFLKAKSNTEVLDRVETLLPLEISSLNLIQV